MKTGVDIDWLCNCVSVYTHAWDLSPALWVWVDKIKSCRLKYVWRFSYELNITPGLIHVITICVYCIKKRENSSL